MKKMMKKWMCLLAVGLLWPGAGTALWAQESGSKTVETTVGYDTLRMTFMTEAGATRGVWFKGSGGFVAHWGDGGTTYLQARDNSYNYVAHFYVQTGTYEVMLCGMPVESMDSLAIATLEASMVYVEGGTFQMGATSEQGDEANDDEKPVHSVTLDGFYIGAYEVTQAQWYAVMGTTIEQQRDKANMQRLYGDGDNYPMYYVLWTEAANFCAKLSELTGKKYRLPTEAEWEYAARGGQEVDGTKYAGSNTIGDVAWCDGTSGYGTHPVGTKQPNAFGIYDMSGNVSEWCSDWYGSYSSSAAVNPQGPESGSLRVFRGGSWGSSAGFCRVSVRDYSAPGDRADYLGFRVVCER